VHKISPDEIKKLLIRGTNWVGDAVMSVPAMREIRRIFRGAQITLLVRPWVKDVYSAVEFVDDVRVYDRSGPHKGWTGLNRIVSELKRERFDAAILLPNSFEAAFLCWRARIPIRIGYVRDGRALLLTHACRIHPDIRKLHQSYYYLGILSEAGLIDSSSWQRQEVPLSITIGVLEEDRRSARQMLQGAGISDADKIVGLNPGAFYGGAKRWLTERYAEVADTLAQRHGVRILLFGAPGERRIAEEIMQKMKCRPVTLAGQTTLGQLMALLLECDLLITNDSGPMHLAAALNVPQLAIFGSTSAAATGPLSPLSEVIGVPVECSPCFLRECPIDFRCMTAITVDRVVVAAEKKLAERRRTQR